MGIPPDTFTWNNNNKEKKRGNEHIGRQARDGRSVICADLGCN
jgi:hypothetical protein